MIEHLVRPAWPTTFDCGEVRAQKLEAIRRFAESRCHRRGCENRKTHRYFQKRRNAHGGWSLFTYERCPAHPISGAEYFEAITP